VIPGHYTWLILVPSSTEAPKVTFPFFNWWDVPLAVILFLVGLALGRKRGHSNGVLIAFAITMLGMVLLGVVASNGTLLSLPLGASVSGIVLVSVFLVGVGLYRRRFLVPYLLAALAVLLIALTFILNAGYLMTALIFGLAFLLLLGSWAAFLMKRKPQTK
jgi:hypothetical protein